MRVRRVVAVAVVVLLPGVPGQAASTPPQRVVSAGYTLPAGHTVGNEATLTGPPTVTGIARSDEDRVTVEANDVSGRAALVVDVTPSQGVTTRHISCGSLVLGLSPGMTVEATPLAGRCPDGTLSLPQGGTVVLSFHKRPRPVAIARRVVPVPPKPPTTAPPSMRWAVLIGINDYAGRTHSTYGGLGDVAVVHKALLAAGWRNDHILILRDREATARNIRWAFDWLAQRSTPRTFSLLHYSGHVCIASRGPCASGHTYLWAHDNRFVPETEVRSRMLRVKGYSWLDVAGCEAGAFDLHSKTRIFSASSRGNETSYESPDWKQSYWTGLVWDRGFLRGLADNKRLAKRATIREMLRYGRERAPGMTRKGPRGAQHPVTAGGQPGWTLYAPPGG